jgi:uncharacterized membrane protein HdeD (DUF308 family)
MPKKKEDVTEGEVVEEKESKEYPKHTEIHIRTKSGGSSRVWLGLILIFVGAMFLIRNFYNIDVWHYFWPLFLVFVGVILLSNTLKR